MRKIISIICLFALLFPIKVLAQEPYAVLSNNNTVLTFYYDNQKSDRGGMDVSSRGWSSANEEINSVIFDSSFANCTTLTSTAYWFFECYNLTSITGLANLNTSNVTEMSFMFFYCSGLTSLDVSGFKTDKVTTMSFMFSGCSGLKTIFVGNGWSTAKVTSSTGMFNRCTKLVGGMGTTYDANHTYATYAHIDGGTANPGYFTDKNAPTPYAVLSNNNTVLTFYYDNQKEARGGMGVGPFSQRYDGDRNNIDSGWDEERENISKVVFDASFAACTFLTSTRFWFYGMKNLTSIIGISNLKTDNVTNMGYMFSSCSNLTSLDLSGFNTDNVTNMNGMFHSCKNLTSLDVSGFNTDNVTNMSEMFSGCSGLTSLDVSGFKTDNVTNTSYMFHYCSGLTSLDVSNIKTDNVTNMGGMFGGCSGLTSLDVSNIKTDNVTNMSGMFRDCSGLTSLDVSNLKTDNVTSMGDMFCNCSGLTSLDLRGFKTDNVTSMGDMFYNCSGLTSLDLSGFNTQNVTSMYAMFYRCNNIQTIFAGSNWSTAKVTSSTGMFDGCTKLVGGKGTTYDANHRDVAYAHIDGGTTNPGYFTDKNAPVVCEIPTISRYGTTNNIVMTCATSGASIYYTTDGTTPTSNSTRYTGSITVDQNCTIKAIAMKDGYESSSVASYSVDWFKVATPTFSFDNLRLTISTTTEDATIYYTTDGSTPTTSSTKYTGPISLSSDCTVKAIAVKDNYTNSDVASYNFVLNDVICQTPTISRSGTTNNIVMTCATFGASIYYTTDGTTPTSNSTRYTGSITVDQNCTIKAIAMKDGYESSSVASYSVDWFKVATPTFSYSNLKLSISTTTSGATIYYTTNGSTPTTSSTKYTGAITLSKDCTVKAIAVKDNYTNSDVATYDFVLNDVICQTPTISRSGTTNNIVMTCATFGASIYYTTDGTTPTSNSTRYTGSITVDQNCTIKAIAMKDGYESSSVASYSVDWFKVATPTFSYSNLKLSISTTTSGATIYYTTNGSTPTTSSTKYTGAITLSKDGTIKAIAVKTNYTNSDVATYNFVLNDVTCQTPTISRNGTTNNIVMTCATSGASIYYTTDGTAPTKNSTQYTGSVTVSENCTIKAIAMKEGMFSSAQSQFTVDWFKVATPTFSYSNLKLTISTTTSGATIYYTTDGSTPTTSSTKYSGAISLSKDCTVKAIAVKNNYTNSEVATYDFVLNDVTCQAPTISRDGTSNSIVMTCATSGASIYYTTDGTTPTSSSTRYTGSITVDQNCTIKAIAMKDGYVSSSVVTYNVNWFKVATPTFSYSNMKLSISTSTSGATIYFTTDGSTPTTSSTKYSGAISLSKDCTVKAIAVKDNYTNSDVASYNFVLNDVTCQTPTISRSGTTNSIVMTCATSGASIYYTTDGTTPTKNSTQYTGTITISGNCTIKAIAMKDGYVSSSVATYNVNWFKVATPTFSYSNLKLSISTTTSGATIYYTTNGSTPTTSSTKYTGAITLSQDCTVKAIAVKENYTNSDVATYNFVLNDVICQTPTISRDGTSNRIVMNCTTTGASIYYTTNGTTPTANSTRYTASITVSGNCTIKAIAMKDGYVSSSVATYNVSWFKVASPTFSYSNMKLSISTTTSGATIYYTTDGTTPTTSSLQYSGPLSLTADCTVKAIAVKTNYTNSDVATYNFVLNDVTCQAPQISRSGTTNSIIMTCGTSGASIYYTTDGTTPTSNSTRYTGSITVDQNCTIKAIAIKDGYVNSGVTTYSVSWFKVATPTFNYSNLKLSISTTTSGATIYYTTDGSAPTTSSTKYSGTISLSKDCTVKAIAVKSGYTNSDVVTYDFVMSNYTCLAPQISRSGTTNNIVMTCGTSGASIYYTTDGTTPTQASTCYSGSITVDHNQTIRAVAMKDGMFNSTQSQFTVDWFKVATPTFSYSNLQLSISTTTSGATIYYTTDGSTPTTSSSKYSGPISLSQDCTVKAIAVKGNYTNSDVAIYDFVLNDVTCQTPTISRDETSNRIVMNCTTTGASIYYTTNGTIPTANSTRYTAPITISGNCTIQAIAMKDGCENSSVATYAVDWFKVATPTFSFDNMLLTISTTTSGAAIYYTTDGSTPTTSSEEYTGTITLSQDCTVKAIAVKDNYNDSEVATFIFKKDDVTCQAPQIQRDETSNDVIMTCATAGATIYYTTNGTTPTENNTRYAGPITVTKNCTIKAIAVKDGYENSGVATYNVDWFKVATPTFSYSNQKLSISTTTEGANIYYTTDGSTPSTTNTKAQVYSSPISLTGSTTVKAIAVKADYTNSDVATYNFVIDSYTCQAPQISRSGTTNSIIMTCGTSGASIYYTTNGTTPTNGSARFSGPITVDHNQTIRAIAMKDGMFNSAQSQFTVDWFKVATPTFSYSNLQLTISTATSGAIVYYTTDGSNPLTDLSKAIRYTNPIQLDADATIKAAAVKTDFNDSEIATYSFVKADYVCKQPQIQRDGTSDRLTMSSATENAIIYYTIDGSTPTTSSTQYTGPVTMPYNCVVRAIATRSDMFPSDVSEFTVDWLTISGVTVAYNNGVLTLTCATQGAEIHYEIGGRDATKSSPLYTGPITLTDNREVRYVVYASGMEPVNGSYTPTDFACAPVIVSYDGLNIELSTTEEGATIYYTLDGSTPTISSAVYRGKTPLTDLCTVKAIAVKTYKNDSEVTQTITYFFDGTTLSMSETGHVKDAMKWSGTDNIPELTIKCQGSGSIGADDMSFLRTIKGLKHLNLKDALFVNNTVLDGAFAGMNIVSVEFPSTNITTLGNVFNGCKHLAAIIWNAHVLMASTAQAAGITNPNLLLYVDNESYAPKQGIRNVIVNGRAKNIVLTDEDGGSYYCPQAFQAQNISYTHTYSQTTGINKECRGWETIALPFDVQTITHEDAGKIAPFAANIETARPFWLGELGSNGFKHATEIRANTPYIISMPNNDVYGSSYILAGKVTFEAVNTMVPVTEIKTASKGTHVFTPCFDAVEVSSTIFAINKNDNAEFTEGSVFLPSYRDVKPFEAYIAVPEVGVAPRYIPIRDDSDTGIEELQAYPHPLPQGKGAMFNLQGQRISVPSDSSESSVLPKGVYIMNGKKVIIR